MVEQERLARTGQVVLAEMVALERIGNHLALTTPEAAEAQPMLAARQARAGMEAAALVVRAHKAEPTEPQILAAALAPLDTKQMAQHMLAEPEALVL